MLLIAGPLRRLATGISVALAASAISAIVLTPAPTAATPPAMTQTAAARAAATGVPVTVDALTTESRLVVANPDGTFTARLNDGPVRFQTAGDDWRDIDNTLIRYADGTIRPAASAQNIVLSGGGTAAVNTVASLGSGERSVAVGWSGALPAPLLDGTSATYPGVRPGVDLVVRMTRTGFEENFVAHDAAALAGLTTLAQPWRTGGLVASAQPGGRISLRDKSGEMMAVPPARMWDAAVNPLSGNPAHTADVDLTPDADGPKGWTALTLRPSTEPLAKTSGWAYPVTVDPGVMSTLYSSWDTFVQKDAADDKDNSGSDDLKIGMEDEDAPTGDVIARSYIHWNTSFLGGANVSAATLYLYNYHSWMCASTYTNWAAYRTSATSSSTRWGSAVTWYTTPSPAASTLTKGASGCSAGFVTANVAGLMDYAADNHLSTFNMGIKASTETKHDGWKRFYSRDNADPDRDPYISVTYNHTPTAPTDSALTTSGKACVTGAGRPGMTTLVGRPVTKVNPVKDSDPADTETVKFYMAKVGSALPTSPTYQVTGVTANASASATIPTSFTLTEGTAYQWRVAVTDASNATSGNSPICEFVVDNFGPQRRRP